METTNEVDNPINNPNMDPSIQEPANEEIHVSIQVPEESTNLETNSENGIEMKPLKQQEQNVPSKSVRINVPITEKELEDENQSEIPQIRRKSASQRRASNRKSKRMTFSSDFNRLLSPGETELDIEILEKDVDSHKSYDVSNIYNTCRGQSEHSKLRGCKLY